MIAYRKKHAILGRMKKVWIAVIALFVLSGVGGGVYYWQVASKRTAPEVSTAAAPTPQPEELAQWKDQAGFSFSYPKSLKSDIHEEDNQNYAHIEFTHPDYPGTIIIWAKDTTAADIATWVKKEKTLAGGTVLDTTLADMDGKKVLLASPKKKVITAVVDEAIVFYVEGEFEDSEFWTKTYDTITSSFAFTPLESAQSQSDGGDETAVDEEEVLE